MRSKAVITWLVFWGLSMAANVFNWLFSLQAGRILAKEDLAVLTVFLSFQYLLGIPAGALGTTVSRFTAYYSQKGEGGKYFYFFRQYWWLSWTAGALFLLIFLLSINFLKAFFGFGSPIYLLIFAPIFLPLFLLAFETGVLFGQLAFVWVGILYLSEAASKFLFFLFSREFLLGKVTASILVWTVLSLPISAAAAWLISVLVGRSYRPLMAENPQIGEEFKENFRFLGSSLFVSLGLVLIYNLDILLVNHFFPPSTAGVYATVSLLGKVLYFGAGSLISLLIPLTARAQAKRESVFKPFFKVLSLMALVGGAIWLAYFFFPEPTVSLLLGQKGLLALPYLAKYSLGMLFLSLSAGFAFFNLARKNYFSANLMTLAAAVQGILVMFFHQSLSQVVEIVFWTLLGLFLGIVLSELFGLRPQLPKNGGGFHRKKRRILILNWRDKKHRQAGGAEVYLHEIGKRLSKKGLAITFFTANDGHCPSGEVIDGVEIVRKGGFITVYFWAAIYFLFRFRGKFDLVIDSENGIPFFSPFYCRRPIILLVYHVHQDIFFRSLHPPLSWLAVFLEGFLMPLVYRQSQVVAISQSTAADLRQGIGLEVEDIIPAGVSSDFFKTSPKAKIPLTLYLGRLKENKSIEILLEAFRPVAWEIPSSRLVIAGEGDWRPFLEEKTRQLGLSKKVRFLGRVSEEVKLKLLGKAWVLVNPSYKEGWGISCLEANACGTPVLAARVDGLREAVSEGESGYLFEYGNTKELSLKLLELLADQDKRQALGRTARSWSKKFSWEKQVVKFEDLISRRKNG